MQTIVKAGFVQRKNNKIPSHLKWTETPTYGGIHYTTNHYHSMKICSKFEPLFNHIIHLVSAHALFKPKIQCAGSFWMMVWYTQHSVYRILCLHTNPLNLVQYTINGVHDMRNFVCYAFVKYFPEFRLGQNWIHNFDYLLKVWMAICLPFKNGKTNFVLTLNAGTRLWLNKELS